MEKVSIIIPMKNAAPYIEKTLNSVLKQSWKNLEVVVVDDKSTDSSRNIVKKKSDTRIKIVAGPGTGVSAAWNTGLAASSGSLIMTSDADDIVPPGSIAVRAEYLSKNKEYGAVCGGFSTIDNKDGLVAHLWDNQGKECEITSELNLGNTRTHLCTYAIRREVVEQLGGKRTYFESAEDIDLQLRISNVCKVCYMPVEMYRWRLHDSSLTHSQNSPRRVFFENYARELSRQRKNGGSDEIERGCPVAPPIGMGKPTSAEQQICGMKIGRVWELYKEGAKQKSRNLALETLLQNPFNISVWKMFLILNLKILFSNY